MQKKKKRIYRRLGHKHEPITLKPIRKNKRTGTQFHNDTKN
jgi:hypothetical protein